MTDTRFFDSLETRAPAAVNAAKAAVITEANAESEVKPPSLTVLDSQAGQSIARQRAVPLNAESAVTLTADSILKSETGTYT